jgi:NDP-sugar pyrophosphorylase family protein
VIRRAMVLAAGFGTRLRPLTDTVPKPLVPVADEPFLDHVLAFLHAGGIRDVVINLHHLGHLIEQHVGDGARFGLRVRYSPEATILDTGGGIKHAEPLLAGEPFVVINGDSLLEVRLRDLVAFHRDHGGIATVALRADPEAARYGLVEIDGQARVRRIVGLPEGVEGAGLRGLMFPGLHVIEPEVFRHMDAGARFSITRTTYPDLLAKHVPIYGWETSARWINIDTPESVASADRELRTRPLQAPA